MEQRTNVGYLFTLANEVTEEVSHTSLAVYSSICSLTL